MACDFSSGYVNNTEEKANTIYAAKRESTLNGHEQFIRLLLPLRHRLHRFACALTDSEEDARNLTADTMLAALENYDPTQPEESFRGYLFTIAVRLHRRRKERTKRIQRFDESEWENQLSTVTPPDVAADIRALCEALAKLPRRQQEALALFEFSALSLQEICRIQGGSLSGVKSRIVRGRKRLAKLLGVEDDTLPQLEAKQPRSEVGRNHQSPILLDPKTE